MRHMRQEPDFTPTISVTKADYELAKRRDRWACAIVRAIQREYPDAMRVMVDTKTIAFTVPDEGRRFYFDTPDKAVEKVIAPLDRGETNLRPFKFTLRNGESDRIMHHDEHKKRELRHYNRTHTDHRTRAGRCTNRIKAVEDAA